MEIHSMLRHFSNCLNCLLINTGMIMRALNTLPGQDDCEKLATNQKQIEELNVIVDGLRNELSEKTSRIEELCRLANDFRDDSERIKIEVSLILFVLNLL